MKTAEQLAKEYAEREASANEKLTLEPFGIEELKTYAYHDFLAGYNAREQWISVEDRLPEGFWSDTKQEYYQRFSQQVNIYVDTGVVGTGAYNRETKKWFVGDLSSTCYQELVTTVTHWQELPNAPKP